MKDTILFEKPKSFIYMITDTSDHVKIGISKNPHKRLKQLQTGHPEILTLYFTEEFECERNHLLKIEKLIHNQIGIQNFKKRGEWFNIPKDKLEEIKDLISFCRIRYEDDVLYFKYRSH